MKVLFLTRYGRLGASSRLRTMQFHPWLQAAGIDCTVQPLFEDKLLSKKYATGRYGLGSFDAYGKRLWALLTKHRFDLIWIEKEALPWLPAWLERLLLAGTPYVVDFDDAVFHNYDLHRSRLVRMLLGKRVDRVMAGAKLALCGNQYLADRARAAGAAEVATFPTVIDLERYAPEAHSAHDQARIVWIGSPSTVKYLAALAVPLAQLAKRQRFTLRLIGGKIALPEVDIEYIPWTEASEVVSIAECDIGIMPLKDSPWERGKCGYKLIQYMACGLPVVASPIGVNVDIVEDGVNGFLAAEADAWVAQLERLLSAPELRRQMGRAGRRLVETDYSVQARAEQMASCLRRAGERKVCAD